MRLNALAYYADFFISFALILMLAVTASWNGTLATVAQWTSCALAGFMVWTLLEYFVHRVLYHNVPYFVEMHDAHHAEPNAYIGAPPVIGVVLILALCYAPIVPFNELAASGFTAGMFAGYMAYMLLHHAAHYWNVRPGTWLYMARRHHALHHYHHEEGNYGIVTSLWDHAFGTNLEHRRRGTRDATQ